MNEEEDISANEPSATSSTSTPVRAYTIADIPELMAGLQNLADLPQQIICLRGFRRLLSIEKNPPVQECIDIGAVPIFVQFLQRQDSMEVIYLLYVT